MFKKLFYYLFVFALVAFLNINSKAQSYGKIVSSDDAQKLLTNVTYSIPVTNRELEDYLAKTSNVLMVNIINKTLYILDNNRQALTPSNEKVEKDVPFKVYSVSLIKELINLGKNNVIYIEQRGDIISLTNGGFTLEFAAICPPWCN